MEGFKQNPKMKSQIACFKEGGYVTKKQLVAYEKKEDKAEEKKDMAEDKKIVKKAISQHEGMKHKGEDKTEIKLKKGGRCKKEGGNVRKYKAGGDVKEEEKMAKAKPKAESAAKKAKPTGYAKGGFFNEEPDSDLATPSKRVMPKKPAPKKLIPPTPQAKPMQGQGAVSDAERQMIMQQFQGGPQGYADGRMVAPNQFRPQSTVDFGPIAQQALMSQQPLDQMSPEAQMATAQAQPGAGVPAPMLQGQGFPDQLQPPVNPILPPQASPMAMSRAGGFNTGRPANPPQMSPMGQVRSAAPNNGEVTIMGRRPY